MCNILTLAPLHSSVVTFPLNDIYAQTSRLVLFIPLSLSLSRHPAKNHPLIQENLVNSPTRSARLNHTRSPSERAANPAVSNNPLSLSLSRPSLSHSATSYGRRRPKLAGPLARRKVEMKFSPVPVCARTCKRLGELFINAARWGAAAR